MSSGICVHIKVSKYLKKYLEHHFGNPVKLPKYSPENFILRRYLVATPKGCKPDLQPADMDKFVRVEIPYFKEVDPRTYNYLHDEAKRLLSESLEALMLNHLWTDTLRLMGKRHGDKAVALMAWCKNNGIDPIADDKEYEALRQRLTRLRRKYLRNHNILTE